MRDIALFKSLGDWPFQDNGDLIMLESDDVIKQRIWVRLRVPKGWINDPTHGTFGSRLRQATRGSEFRMNAELPMLVREALAPMTDIEVGEVRIENLSESSVLVHIEYRNVGVGVLYNSATQFALVEIPV